MQKMLTKTIVSILLCLSLALSSVGFLPMNVFAGSDGAGTGTAPAAVKVSGITILGVPAAGMMKVGQEITLTAEFSPNNAEDEYKKVEWTSNKPEVIEVDQSTGKITAKSTGTATITATAKNGSEDTKDWVSVSRDITVEAVPVESVSFDKTSLEMSKDTTHQLIATVSPSNATDQTITWSSNAEGVAEVDSTGLVTAKSDGQATITATTTNGKTATCQVTVIIPVTSVTLSASPAAGMMKVGQEITLTATFDPGNAENYYKKVEWECTGVDEDGSGMIAKDITLTTTDTTATIKVNKPGTITVKATAKNGETDSTKWATQTLDIQVFEHILEAALIPGNELTISFVDHTGRNNTIGYKYQKDGNFEQSEYSKGWFMEQARISLIDVDNDGKKDTIKVEVDGGGYWDPGDILTINLNFTTDEVTINPGSYAQPRDFTIEINGQNINNNLIDSTEKWLKKTT